jgi:hypothetical protein
MKDKNGNCKATMNRKQKKKVIAAKEEAMARKILTYYAGGPVRHRG